MPTLINPPNPTHDTREEAADDVSVTILLEENETLLATPLASQRRHRNSPLLHQSPFPFSSARRHEKSVTFDDDTILCSTSKPTTTLSYSNRRRGTLDSNISLSLEDDKCLPKDDTKIVDHQSGQKNSSGRLSQHFSTPVSAQYPYQDVNDLPWPNKDQYRHKHQDFVKKTIADFNGKYPGKLRDYRTMSSKEKAQEQQRVLALLTRLGISKGSNGSSQPHTAPNPSFAPRSPTTPVPNPNHAKKILDETLSPAFTPTPCHRLATRCAKTSSEQPYEEMSTDSPSCAEKSELLLSMDVGHTDTLNGGIVDKSKQNVGHEESFQFPVGNGQDSESSMELVRRAPRDVLDSDVDDNASNGTPEDQMIDKSSSKRLASTSGKRGSDMRRMRLNDPHQDYDMDLSNRLGRLSLSPDGNAPPENLFVASQSPISPKLTYHSPNDKNEDEYSANSRGSGDSHIDWGRDSDGHRRRSDLTVDSIATNTPPVRYRSDVNRGRSFREVPLNVSLKDGATFHLDKLAVKRSEQARSARPVKTRVNAMQNRRLVNFPDPFARYNSRTKCALKEIYSWIRTAEREHEKGNVDVPAAGVFFSLSEQQIIDISLKLLLRDLSDNSGSDSRKGSASILTGNTLVVVRSKEDTAVWERALREQTGCSVSNHSALSLSERIRPSSAEKTCVHDVVLTTYDAMKSPDMAIPVTNDGHAILTNSVGNSAGWYSSRTSSQLDSSTQWTKQFSFLHRIKFKRVVFVDNLGRKCYLAKGGTARASAAVALPGDTRIVFFQELASDGSDPLRALRKSDKKAIESVSKVLRLPEEHEDNETSCDDEDKSSVRNPLEMIAMDFKDLC